MYLSLAPVRYLRIGQAPAAIAVVGAASRCMERERERGVGTGTFPFGEGQAPQQGFHDKGRPDGVDGWKERKKADEDKMYKR